jgi:hypothetical protein
MKIKDILVNAIQKRNFLVMVKKVFKRFEIDSSIEANKWANDNSISLDEYCNKINPRIWKESIKACNQIELQGVKTLDGNTSETMYPDNAISHSLGGGGAYPLIYFHCRIIKPKIVVETGVAAGWSSFAILESLRINGQGKLYSSDFPYFRLKNPEQFIGYVVPESIRNNWYLDIRGDGIAIPEICNKVQNIDIFHYDSDKSYSGRLFAIKQIQKKLSLNSIVIFDDIQDNLFFKNLVKYLNCEYQVFAFEGKFVGQLEGFNITNQKNINI